MSGMCNRMCDKVIAAGVLPATPLFAAGGVQTSYELAPLVPLTEWWHWLLMLAICGAGVAIVAVVYWFDRIEQPWGLSLLLLSLRLTALALLILCFFNPQKRTERRIVKNSRVSLLVDTSLSMGLRDTGPGGLPSPESPSRMEQVVRELQQADFLRSLRRKHDVVVYRFDAGAKPTEIAAFGKLPESDAASEAAPVGEMESARRELSRKRLLTGAGIAGGVLACALAALLVHIVLQFGSKRHQAASWALFVGVHLILIALGVLAVFHVRHADYPVLAELGLAPYPKADEASDSPADDAAKEREVDWAAQLRVRGAETRLGDAIRFVVNKERGGPAAGLVVCSDGGANAGVDLAVTAAAAKDARIPVFAIGMGSTRRPVNAKVVDLQAPPRVYPGDRFTLNGFVQAAGLEGRSVTVKLVSASGADSQAAGAGESLEEERRITLLGDGELLPVKFDVVPREQGRRTYKLRVEPGQTDHDPTDNVKTASVEIVDRKNRVLVMAGGPGRDYQFLRNLLFRDRDTTLDVWLQSGEPGISQESHNLLFEFPSLADELFEYDCIVAFDADWTVLNDRQVDLLERWVSEKAGGLIVVGGPVDTPKLSGERGDSRIDTIRALYPVSFYSRNSPAMRSGRFGGEAQWPLQFSREGLEAEFLWLDETALASEQAWASFKGVCGYYAVKDPKPGAHVYARFSDPETAIDGELPVYMAGHYYGAGRVFFMASGEMWRLRAVDEAYFERFYTKLIRWASQGRLLRDSARGLLRVDKDRCLLGDDVAIDAILTDAQHQPLAVPEVAAVLIRPDGARQSITLRKSQGPGREGMYAGQFTAMLEGDYRIELTPPGGDGAENVLNREVRVRIPELELEKPLRNDALLKDLTEKTNARYFVGFDAAMNRGSDAARGSLAGAIAPQDQETFLPGSPDPGKRFQRVLMAWLLGLTTLALCLEWTLRRLNRLA